MVKFVSIMYRTVLTLSGSLSQINALARRVLETLLFIVKDNFVGTGLNATTVSTASRTFPFEPWFWNQTWWDMNMNLMMKSLWYENSLWINRILERKDISAVTPVVLPNLFSDIFPFLETLSKRIFGICWPTCGTLRRALCRTLRPRFPCRSWGWPLFE